jgi:chromatin remodeling complex protein RSC6
MIYKVCFWYVVKHRSTHVFKYCSTLSHSFSLPPDMPYNKIFNTMSTATQVSTVAPAVKKTAPRKRTTPAVVAQAQAQAQAQAPQAQAQAQAPQAQAQAQASQAQAPETPAATVTTNTCVGEPSAPRKKSKPARPVETEATVTEVTDTHEPSIPGSARRKLTTSADVCEVIDHAILSIKEQSHVAKLEKNKDLAAALNAIAKELALVKKPIDKLARSKPARKVSIDPARNGFLRPLQLSPELATFMGCEPSEMRSRVAVTQKICAYIKEHELQDPTNRRNILVDNTLKNLLNYDPESAEEPLSYYMLQARIQRHFPKTTEVTCAS